MLSGSSLATAIAAGFAALIIHIINLVNYPERATNWNFEGMERAFKASGISASKYVLVENLFKTDIRNRGCPLDENVILQKVATKLYPPD